MLQSKQVVPTCADQGPTPTQVKFPLDSWSFSWGLTGPWTVWGGESVTPCEVSMTRCYSIYLPLPFALCGLGGRYLLVWFFFFSCECSNLFCTTRNLVWLVEIDSKKEPGELPSFTPPFLQNRAINNLDGQWEETHNQGPGSELESW